MEKAYCAYNFGPARLDGHSFYCVVKVAKKGSAQLEKELELLKFEGVKGVKSRYRSQVAQW